MHASVSLSIFALVAGAAAKGVWTTPHDSYSSSVGVLGCKINTDRVAYWPESVGCDNICVKLSHGGRSVHLLRIDQSGGAYDISYDAWVYLQTGQSAAENPITGGTVAMEYEDVPASECAHLINTPGNKIPLSASNSMNYLVSCLAEPNSYVAKNHVLYNICDAICSLGHDEECNLNLDVSNQPSCPHTLGLTSPLTGAPVINILYQTGEAVIAGSGAPASPKPKAQEPPSQPQTPAPEDPAQEPQSQPQPPAPEDPASTDPLAAPAPAPAETTTTAGAIFKEQSSVEPTTTSTTTPSATDAAKDVIATTTSSPVILPTLQTSAPVNGTFSRTTLTRLTTTTNGGSTPSGSRAPVVPANAAAGLGASPLVLGAALLGSLLWAGL